MARTLVTNTSGATRFFGFIPPHGAQLANGDGVLLDGDLVTLLAGGLNRFSRKTEISALKTEIADGNVVVVDLQDSSSSLSS
jgi:hypothetical protein